jgi:hypothetical protein
MRKQNILSQAQRSQGGKKRANHFVLLEGHSSVAFSDAAPYF